MLLCVWGLHYVKFSCYCYCCKTHHLWKHQLSSLHLLSINDVEFLAKTVKLMLVLNSLHSCWMFLRAMHDDEYYDDVIIIIEKGGINYHALYAITIHLLLTIDTWCHCVIALEFFSLTFGSVNCHHRALGSNNCDAHCCYLVILLSDLFKQFAIHSLLCLRII